LDWICEYKACRESGCSDGRGRTNVVDKDEQWEVGKGDADGKWVPGTGNKDEG